MPSIDSHEGITTTDQALYGTETAPYDNIHQKSRKSVQSLIDHQETNKQPKQIQNASN